MLILVISLEVWGLTSILVLMIFLNVFLGRDQVLTEEDHREEEVWI